MILYLESSRGISAALVLGALLDAGADAALVQRILGTVTLPRIALLHGRERAGPIAGTAASVAIGPLPRDTPFIGIIRTLERGRAPLAVRTWGGGMLLRLMEAEALVRGEPLDTIPLADPVTAAELLAVSAALAALQIVRVYAAPAERTKDVGPRAKRDSSDSVLSPQSSVLLSEAGWEAEPGAAVTAGGAAILAALAEPGVPSVRLGAVGYGIAGEAPHILRCWLGTPYDARSGPARAGGMGHIHSHNDGDAH